MARRTSQKQDNVEFEKLIHEVIHVLALRRQLPADLLARLIVSGFMPEKDEGVATPPVSAPIIDKAAEEKRAAKFDAWAESGT